VSQQSHIQVVRIVDDLFVECCCRYAGSEADLCRLVQPRRSVYVVNHLSPVYDLRRPLHDADLPAALRTRQEEEAHHHEDSARVDRVVLHCRAAVRPVDVGSTSGRHRRTYEAPVYTLSYVTTK